MAYLTMYLTSSRGKIVYLVFLSCENKYTPCYINQALGNPDVRMKSDEVVQIKSAFMTFYTRAFTTVQ